MRGPAAIGLLVALTGAATGAVQPAVVGPEPRYEETLPRDHPALTGDDAAGDDALAELAGRVASGAFRFDVHPDHGVLPSLLAALDVPADSQVLVFSKTSFQFPRISPRLPRAVYFNESVAVGVVPGSSVVELATVHPRAGARFYTLEGPRRADAPIVRRDACLRCHHGVATMGVPGLFVSSVFPSPSGTPEREGAIVTDHRTFFADRWGGWFVSGVPSGLPHRGNAVARNPAAPTVLSRMAPGRAPGSGGMTDYLSTTSDPVALMTLEHQTQAYNHLTRLGWEARLAAHEGGPSRISAAGLARRIDDTARYLLFLDEAPWPAALATRSAFAASFAARGPRDAQGRSLREFELTSRLFRHRLSPVIYSPVFDALPDGTRVQLLERLFDALTDRAPLDGRVRPGPGERTAILEIVRDTKAGLPGRWQAFHATSRRPH